MAWQKIDRSCHAECLRFVDCSGPLDNAILHVRTIPELLKNVKKLQFCIRRSQYYKLCSHNNNAFLNDSGMFFYLCVLAANLGFLCFLWFQGTFFASKNHIFFPGPRVSWFYIDVLGKKSHKNHHKNRFLFDLKIPQNLFLLE